MYINHLTIGELLIFMSVRMKQRYGNFDHMHTLQVNQGKDKIVIDAKFEFPSSCQHSKYRAQYTDFKCVITDLENGVDKIVYIKEWADYVAVALKNKENVGEDVPSSSQYKQDYNLSREKAKKSQLKIAQQEYQNTIL